jgi:methylated-DNA-[protein]-cysteine S-methyltransferase
VGQVVAAAGFDAVLTLPCAAVGVRVRAAAIAEIAFLPFDTPVRLPSNGLAARACEQILAYADDPSRGIDLPLAVEGSEFQQRVWAAIARIPSGATRTYGELARELGSTARAVGQACGDNRLPLAIPCHRVVAARGTGGFAHRTDRVMLDVKRWLLAHESRPAFALTP